MLLCRLQRSRVEAITALLDQRTALLGELVSLQEREQRELAEALHDGALQYVLAARQELEDAVAGDEEAARRTDQALGEAGRLLRATTSQLHPAVLEAAGLPAALAEVVRSVEARGRFGRRPRGRRLGRRHPDLGRRPAPRHRSGAADQRGQARRREPGATCGWAGPPVWRRWSSPTTASGTSGTDLDTRLRSGHLGLASRRIRVEAAGGSIEIGAVQPHGTQVQVRVPAPDLPAAG